MSPLKLRLFITGQTPRAKHALANLHRIGSEELAGKYKYELEIIDVLEHPQLAEDEKILATPTLIRELPLPPRRVIGDLSDRKQVLVGLDLQTGVEDATSSGESS